MLFTIRKSAQVSLPKHIMLIVVLVSVHSYFISVYLPMCLSAIITAFAFLRIPLSSKELGFIHNPLTIQKKVWTVGGLTKLTSYQIRIRYDSVCTPTELRAVKYKYSVSIYFLSAFQ